MMPRPLTDSEKAIFDTIKQVTRSPRPTDLQLWRMQLDGDAVAVIVQRVTRSADGVTAGFQPLAVLVDDDTAQRLRTVEGRGTEAVPPEGLEGAA